MAFEKIITASSIAIVVIVLSILLLVYFYPRTTTIEKLKNDNIRAKQEIKETEQAQMKEDKEIDSVQRTWSEYFWGVSPTQNKMEQKKINGNYERIKTRRITG